MSNPNQNEEHSYGEPNGIELTRREKLSNLWKQAVAKVKDDRNYDQIGILPTGEKGTYTMTDSGHLGALDND